MSGHRQILVVDDKRRVRDILQRDLEQEGFTVALAADGTDMCWAISEHRSDLILLDLVLPDVDGLQLAREIRAESQVPIIMLTDRGDIMDRVVGLEIGADDYLAQPFQLREVLASLPCFDSASRNLTAPDRRGVELTRGEFDLLRTFVAAPQRTLTREVLTDLVKGQVQGLRYDVGQSFPNYALAR